MIGGGVLSFRLENKRGISSPNLFYSKSAQNKLHLELSYALPLWHFEEQEERPRSHVPPTATRLRQARFFFFFFLHYLQDALGGGITLLDLKAAMVLINPSEMSKGGTEPRNFLIPLSGPLHVKSQFATETQEGVALRLPSSLPDTLSLSIIHSESWEKNNNTHPICLIDQLRRSLK